MSKLSERLRAPAYWMSGSSEGHEGENDAPYKAAARLDALAASHRELVEAARRVLAGNVVNSDPTKASLEALGDAYTNAKRLEES